jgi:hypothetical protein
VSVASRMAANAAKFPDLDMVRNGPTVGQECILGLLIDMHPYPYVSILMFERCLRCWKCAAAKSRILACKQTDRVLEWLFLVSPKPSTATRILSTTLCESLVKSSLFVDVHTIMWMASLRGHTAESKATITHRAADTGASRKDFEAHLSSSHYTGARLWPSY